MKILMIAPEPFFEPRGTPFSEYYRIKALSELGHQIDLVTYPIGEDKDIDGLKIIRAKTPFNIKKVKTGPSAAKLVLDFFLFFKAWKQLRKGKYDLIHTHEEANIMGVFFNKLSKVPHLYDMHSSLVQQMDNFKFTTSGMIKGVFKIVEKMSLKNAASAIVICKSLFDHAAEITSPDKLVMIENFIDDTPEQLDTERLAALEKELGKDKKKLIIYTGTLEKYQGIPFLLKAFSLLDENYKLVLVGGKPYQVDETREEAESLGVSERVHMTGRLPFDNIPYYLAAADALVSPRILGTNIPLKIYQYLKSGTPVVATDLYTHTQTLTDKISILPKPEPEDFAQGIRGAVSEKGVEVARGASQFCKENYSKERYLELVSEVVNKAVK